MQKPRKSGRKSERKRFKPPPPPSIVGSTKQVISGHPQTGLKEAIDVCFRFNGALMSLPQSLEEEKAMDKTLWNFMMKSVANNITLLIEEELAIWIYVAAETEFIPEVSVEKKLREFGIEMSSRESYYAPDGKLEYYHSLTGAKLTIHREGFVTRQVDTFYKLPQQSIRCISSMKKRTIGSFWDERLDPICLPLLGSIIFDPGNFICLFHKEPTFKIRGLCKDAVMDTQFKFADPAPGELDYLNKHNWNLVFGTRSFVGPKGWVIKRSKTDKLWRMSHYHYSDLTLTMLDQDSIPIGRHKWLVENNVCNEGETSTEVLLVSGCEEGQFTCDDGKCLQIEQRCNNIEVRKHIVGSNII